MRPEIKHGTSWDIDFPHLFTPQIYFEVKSTGFPDRLYVHCEQKCGIKENPNQGIILFPEIDLHLVNQCLLTDNDFCLPP